MTVSELQIFLRFQRKDGKEQECCLAGTRVLMMPQYSVGNTLQNHNSVGKVPAVSQNSITEVDKQINNINVAKNTLLTLGYINEDMISKI